MTEADDAARPEASSYPLIVYIHVPKTAGTTIKTILTLCTPFAYGVEFVIDDRAAFLELARNSDSIGGHTSRESVAKGLIWLDRPVEYFSSVREPVAQLVSHLNWSFEKYSLKRYYNIYDLNEQMLDAEVISIDFSNPAAVMNFLLRYADHYLNVQSQCLLGADFAEISDEEIARRLASYTYVASEHDMPKLYRSFGFAQLPEGVDEIRENVAKRHINAQVFDSPQLQEFLAYHHRHDLRLYAAVRGASWPAERRRPFRPAMLGFQVFTFENFDEQTYLDCNPDVAIAVKRGDCESGRAHFEQYGCKENRMIRRWILPAAVSVQKSNEADFSASAVRERLRGLREKRARVAAELQSRQQELHKKAGLSAIPVATTVT